MAHNKLILTGVIYTITLLIILALKLSFSACACLLWITCVTIRSFSKQLSIIISIIQDGRGFFVTFFIIIRCLNKTK